MVCKNTIFFIIGAMIFGINIITVINLIMNNISPTLPVVRTVMLLIDLIYVIQPLNINFSYTKYLHRHYQQAA
jgi:hypothetical protein